jgi:sodium-dependent phosphate cotransporter
MTTAAAPKPSSPTSLRVARLLALLVVSIYLFLIGLELIRSGARPLTRWFKTEGTSQTIAGSLGAGWILACVALSGSPIAALSLGLLDEGSLQVPEAFGMITGSRLGASFVVLVTGFLYDLRSKGRRDGTYVGALALLTTAMVYVPAFFVGYWLLDNGWLDGIHFGAPAQLTSILEVLVKPPARAAAAIMSPVLQALTGVVLLLSAFKLFDGFLPVVDPSGGKLSNLATTVYRPWITFLLGMLVTCVTLSVSVSLTLLVPLTARGLVRRENLIPYIMGANITTFVDTLAASLLLKNPGGFTVVLAAVLSVSAISLPIILFTYRGFEKMVDALAQAATANTWRVAMFVLVLFSIPLLLIWFQ